jgi:hypothetical protein
MGFSGSMLVVGIQGQTASHYASRYCEEAMQVIVAKGSQGGARKVKIRKYKELLHGKKIAKEHVYELLLLLSCLADSGERLGLIKPLAAESVDGLRQHLQQLSKLPVSEPLPAMWEIIVQLLPSA